MELEPPLADTLLARLVVDLADAVIVADTAGTICFWNGSSLDLIIPERQRTRHWDGYRRVMSTGTTSYASDLLRVPSLHSDGQRRSIAFTVTLLKDADGTVAGIAAVIRDETERWKEEQELRRLAQVAPDASNTASSAADRAPPG